MKTMISKLFLLCVLAGMVSLCCACAPMTYADYNVKQVSFEKTYAATRNLYNGLYGDQGAFFLAALEIQYERDKRDLQKDKQNALEEWHQLRTELNDEIAKEQNPQKRAELNRELQNVEREIQLFQTSGK